MSTETTTTGLDAASPGRGLVLTGGGARGAYQAGVIRGLAEIASKRGHAMPFEVVTGASAGAINAAYVAATADHFAAASVKLAEFWGKLHTRDVFHTDVVSLGRIGMQWVADIMLAKLKKTKGARALLDTEPLHHLLGGYIPFERIRSNLDKGALRAFEVTATDYHTSENISFIMTQEGHPGWTRSRRRAVPTDIALEHVMASAAIPLFFPPIEIAGRHYGDGCLRNPAPLSPAIRLGARKLLIIGVRHPKRLAQAEDAPLHRPTIGRVMGTLLNAVLMDAVEFDIERLTRINSTLHAIPRDLREPMPLKSVDLLVMQPSEDLGAFAASQFSSLPDSMRYLIGGLGNRYEGSEIVSYLLFEPAYCGYLTELGRKDALGRKDEIEAYLFGG